MNFVVVGTNHKYSPIEIREKLSFTKGRIKDALISLVDFKWIKAAVIISTCNRVELYAVTQDIEMGTKRLKEFLLGYHYQELPKIEPYLYTYEGKRAILHLFNVAAGLDSQIIGENQIFAQVRFAWEQAKIVEATDSLLDRVFNKAIKTSLKVRQETQISRGKVSLGSVVMELIKTKYISLCDKKILIIGVGKISELVVRYLNKEKVKAVFISNRTYEKACQLARHINAQVVRFDRLKEKLLDTDIIISVTSSPHLILRKDDLREAKRPLLIIDLAVPRDVEPTVKSIKGAELFNLDDLGSIIENNLDKRKQAIPLALEIIKKEVEDLCLVNPLELEPEPAPLP